MNVSQAASIFESRTSAADSNNNPPKTESSRDPLSDKSVFLQLLVSQIKYQNPLEPADSIQYVTQLNQFSATEQLVEIRKLLASDGSSNDNKQGGSSEKGGQF